jgi:two-component system sensor histidine kinase PhcS
MSNSSPDNQEIRQAFAEYDRQVTVSNFKVACTIGMALMPAGVILDYYVYPEMVGQFLKLRLASSALIAVFFGILLTPFGRNNYRFFGVTLFMIPAAFIAWMIYATEGAPSPYYAGLNLVLLVLAFVLHWTFWESFTAAILVALLYVTASLAHSEISRVTLSSFVNNLYFLLLTGIIVVTGSYFHSLSRFREFALRYELDKSKRQLETQNTALATANRQIKEAEAELVQSEKLASLGRMSAGIIHEINNPLNFAKTGLYTLKNKSKHIAPEQKAEYLEIIQDVEDGFNRVSGIVSSLRGFTHHDDQSCDHIPVADLVESSLRFVSHEWSEGIRLELNLTPGQTLFVNKNKLIQVCLNLLENALHAMKNKAYPAGESPCLKISSCVGNGVSTLTFRDNGPGIQSENLTKIFDPFFTTKDVGAGMGMGLSICHRIVQSYGGEIRVKTEPGEYCEFTLEFPSKD